MTARRNELVKLQLVKDTGIYNGLWNNAKKLYHFWAIAGDERQPGGWKRLPDKPHIESRDKCTGCQFKHEHIRMEAEKRLENRIQKTGDRKQEPTLFEI